MPPRITEQRHQGNIESLRSLVNSGSQSVVRDTVVGSAISGSRRKYPLPSIGHRSGKLTVTGYVRGARLGVKALIVQCECNQVEYTVDHHNFKNFRSTRCPLCAKKAASTKRYWTYSEAMADDAHRTRLLNRLSAAITRCHNPNAKKYKDYGGRGIYVCQEWRDDRAAFLKYAKTLDGWDNSANEIDRLDNDKGYEPGNIRFATRSENMLNKRKVERLQAQINDLRSRLRRAEESLHRVDGTGAGHSS